MNTQRMLLKKDLEGKILSMELLLNDTDIVYEVIDDAPVIEYKEGVSGQYVITNENTISVEYFEIPKSDMEILQEQLSNQEKLIADLMLQIAMQNKESVGV